VTSADPDADAMLRVKRGDSRAFGHLVERFLRPLAGFFRRLGADGATAEDCAQEVFLRLFRSRADYEPRARFSTYLFSIARHHWIDVVRHRAAGPRTVSAESETGGDDDGPPSRERLPGHDAAPDSEARRGEVEAAVRRAVATLSVDQREVFALVQGEGLRYQDIAEILGIPVGTVKSRVHATMQALRERLTRDGFEP
jgi:RNA polymerase sigma-70 factor, ECF subfamily